MSTYDMYASPVATGTWDVPATGAARAGRPEHGLVEVDPDDLVAAPAELDGHPAGAAPRIEHGPGTVGGDQRRLTVHVHAGRGQPRARVVEKSPAMPNLGIPFAPPVFPIACGHQRGRSPHQAAGGDNRRWWLSFRLHRTPANREV